jgi:S1-C subfamily serine protease
VRDLLLIALAALALLWTGCAVADEAPEGAPTYTLPDVAPTSSEVSAAERTQLPDLARDSPARQAKRLTVRVRNVGCAGVATGSGFAIARDILITNRHVLAGASLLEVSTWDGRTFEITAAAVGRLGDLGIARVEAAFRKSGASAPHPRLTHS